MALRIDAIIENAFEQSFSRALDHTRQAKAEELFRKAFANGSTLSRKLEEKIEQGFERFLNGIVWDRKRPGFKK